MKNRSLVLIAALALVILPALLAAGEAAWYHRWIAENGTVVSSGIDRSFHLYVPPSYDRSKPAPLVISLHGAGMRAVAHMHTSQWNRVADRHGFLVVYPSAVKGRGPLVWEFGDERGATIIDVRFIVDLIDHVAGVYTIDRARIYANGLSNGGGMSFALSCTLSDRFAAVGLVGTAFTIPWDWCTDDRPVPMIAFHGTRDTGTPYHGGKTWVAPPGRVFPSIPGMIENWARRNRCTAESGEMRVTGDVTRRSYSNCADDANVVFYTIEGGGHTWPGGGPLPEWFVGTTTNTIDASTVMWEFFSQHARRQN
jgi:polyhydroxybutyrate depolymerase